MSLPLPWDHTTRPSPPSHLAVHLISQKSPPRAMGNASPSPPPHLRRRASEQPSRCRCGIIRRALHRLPICWTLPLPHLRIAAHLSSHESNISLPEATCAVGYDEPRATLYFTGTRVGFLSLSSALFFRHLPPPRHCDLVKRGIFVIQPNIVDPLQPRSL